MITIKKSVEPRSWLLHRLTEGADYEATEDLRNALLRDQGFICAYCMRRIPVKDNGTGETSRIEHIKPQSLLTRTERMDYGNLVICCPGAIGSTASSATHCDRRKGESPLSFSPLDPHAVETLRYRGDGTIESTDAGINEDINNILNLNNPLLKLNRKQVRTTLISMIGKGNWKKSDLEKILTDFRQKDSEGRLKEYCGVIISFIEKRLRVSEK
ncbi:MAG: hypothetical protein HDR98_07785 [Bacteroides sp.]|nr:hypothetical protein [Bacteroides sp.]